MLKKLITLLLFIAPFFINVSSVSAACVNHVCAPGNVCTLGEDSCQSNNPNDENSYSCQFSGTNDSSGRPIYQCQADVFGKIKPPDALRGLVSLDPTGAGGLGKFLSNLIALIYVIAAIFLILMLLWGAFDWITSEGDKEKLQGAQKKIINAIIGILLFAAAFAVIKVIGQFTGFEFFVGQNSP